MFLEQRLITGLHCVLKSRLSYLYTIPSIHWSRFNILHSALTRATVVW